MSLIRKLGFLMLFTPAVLLFSCKKETTEETCSDGFQNQGEAGVDCGGPCTPCASQSGPPYFYALIEDSANFYTNVNVTKIADTFSFQAINNFAEIRFGIYFIPNHDATEDSALMVSNSAYAQFGAAIYDQAVFVGGQEQIGAIMVENASTNILEGNFTFRVMNDTGSDTVDIFNGQFSNVTYE